MTPAALTVFLVLTLVLAGTAMLSLSVRFRSVSLMPEKHAILALPLLILALATLGSWFTVGPFGHISIPGILVLGLTFFLLRPQWVRPHKNILGSVFGFTGFGLLLAGIRFYTLWQPVEGQFLSTHHDDYSYIQQINLLALTGKESHFAELIRAAFGLEYQYSLYHLIEFYLVLLFKRLAPTDTFLWFHFFLKPIFSAWAAFSLFCYIRSIASKNVNSVALACLVMLIFSCLRFNLLDEYIQAWQPSYYWKSVFFQNYYFAAPLAYHVSYKISIALLFTLPLLAGLFELSMVQLGVFLLAASAASVGLFPISIALVAGKAAHSGFGSKIYIRVVAAGLAFLFIMMPLVADFGQTNYFKSLYSSGFYLFNLLFENHYWILFWGFLGVLMAGIGGKTKIILALILLFPLVYLAPGLLFKVFALASMGSTFFAFYSQTQWRKSPVFMVFIPALAAMGMVLPGLSNIQNVQQVFTNLIFPAVALLVLEIFAWKTKTFGWGHIAWIVPVFLGIQLPALLYDNRTPLHQEKIPQEVFQQPIFQKKLVRVLSVSRYHKFPAIDEYMLGHGLLDKKSNLVISLAGPEQFDSTQIARFKQSTFWKPLSRMPYFDAYFHKNQDLWAFIKMHQVDFILVEEAPVFYPTISELKLRATAKWKEPERNYWIFAMNP